MEAYDQAFTAWFTSTRDKWSWKCSLNVIHETHFQQYEEEHHQLQCQRGDISPQQKEVGKVFGMRTSHATFNMTVEDEE
jgi:hypothetical protein